MKILMSITTTASSGPVLISYRANRAKRIIEKGVEIAFSDSTYWVARLRFPYDADDVGGRGHGEHKKQGLNRSIDLILGCCYSACLSKSKRGEGRDRKWGVRGPAVHVPEARLATDDDSDSDFENEMHSEVATMRLRYERTLILVATVFRYNVKQQNPFHYCRLAESAPKQQQVQVAEKLAEILHQLKTRMAFDKTGRIWCGESGDVEPSIAYNWSGISGRPF